MDHAAYSCRKVKAAPFNCYVMSSASTTCRALTSARINCLQLNSQWRTNLNRACARIRRDGQEGAEIWTTNVRPFVSDTALVPDNRNETDGVRFHRGSFYRAEQIKCVVPLLSHFARADSRNEVERHDHDCDSIPVPRICVPRKLLLTNFKGMEFAIYLARTSNLSR